MAYIDRAAERPTLGGALSAVIRYRSLLWNLVLKDLRLKYRGSALGFLWSLVNPLIMLSVYAVAFRYIVRAQTPGFVFLLLLGLLPWTAFAASLGMSTGAIVDNSGITKSVYFPRAILPLAAVLFNYAQYLLTMAVFLPILMVAYRIAPSPSMLLYPIVLLLQVAMTAGLAFALAALTTLLRDVRHLVEVGLQVLFWATPIIYSISILSPAARRVVALTPLSPFIISYQMMFYEQRWPGAGELVPATLYALVSLIIGWQIFSRLESRFGELV